MILNELSLKHKLVRPSININIRIVKRFDNKFLWTPLNQNGMKSKVMPIHQDRQGQISLFKMLTLTPKCVFGKFKHVNFTRVNSYSLR